MPYTLQGDRYEEYWRLYDVAAHNSAAAGLRKLHHARVHLRQAFHGNVTAQPERDGCIGWRASHRRNIADIGCQCLPAKIAPTCVTPVEMNAFDHRIGGENADALWRVPGSGIISYRPQHFETALVQGLDVSPAGGGNRRRKLANQLELTYVSHQHCRIVSGRGVTLNDSE